MENFNSQDYNLCIRKNFEYCTCKKDVNNLSFIYYVNATTLKQAYGCTLVQRVH